MFIQRDFKRTEEEDFNLNVHVWDTPAYDFAEAALKKVGAAESATKTNDNATSPVSN